MLTILPPEISINIIKLLDFRDVLACQAVCKSWYALINDNIIWKTFWESDTPLKECRVRKDFNWTFEEPCQWKMYLLNHMRIIKNWKTSNYKSYEINGRWIRTTAYDGQTLIINNNDYLEVYKIYHGSLTHVQKLKFKNFDVYNCVTNTQYICVKYIPFVIVYHLVKGKYKLSHLFYNQESDKEIVCIKNPKNIGQNDIQMKYESYWPNLMCILGDTLFMSVPHLQIHYAWDLKKMKTIFTTESHLDTFINDLTHVYICSDGQIMVYDQFGSLCFKMNCKWPVSKLLINNNIIIALKKSQCIITEITAWDKNNGIELLNKKIRVSFDCLLHPKLNIIIDIVEYCHTEYKEIHAFDVKSEQIVWKCDVKDCILGEIHSIVAKGYLLFSTYSRRIFNVHDIKSGKFLYSLYGIDNDDVFASYDILIHSNNKKFKLVVQVYS